MARYYLLADYLAPTRAEIEAGDAEWPERSEENNAKTPENYTVLSIRAGLQVRAVFCCGDRGLFLIKAPNRREAYSLANAIQAFFSVCFGDVPRSDRSTYTLTELNRVPQPSWTRADLLRALRETSPWMDETSLIQLCSGVCIQPSQMVLFPEYVGAICLDAHLNEAMTHLNQSRTLFYGFMIGGYYGAHYREERPRLSRSVMEKRYLENRPRYELAFLAAFKAIERFLRVNDLKKAKVREAFARLPYSSISHRNDYRRKHEIFSGLPETTTYGDLVKHFLDIRNVVAAHANRKPPPKFIISEDNLYEIQLFVSELFHLALENTVRHS